MAKYDPLMDWLLSQRAATIEMTFDELDRIVGGLPRSAFQYREWWANEEGQSTHVQCKAWMRAGYMVERVDLDRKRIAFRRA